MFTLTVSLVLSAGVLAAFGSRARRSRVRIPEQRRPAVPPSAEVAAWAQEREGPYPGVWRFFRHLSSPAAPHAGPSKR